MSRAMDEDAAQNTHPEPDQEEKPSDEKESLSAVTQESTRKRNISTCQRHDLSMKYATIGNNIQSKLKHELIPELEKVSNWRQVLCWKYRCDVLGPGGFVYASIYDAMRAEKMRFMVDQLEIHTFLEFVRKDHSLHHPRDVVTVSDENFLSQNNLTLNGAVWDIVRRKLLYGYIRQRIRVDPTFYHILQVLEQRSITPILFYPHSTPDTYYYGKLNRAEVDTTYQKTTLRKKQRAEVDIQEVRNEVVILETREPVIGRNVYGELLIQATRDHRLHLVGQTLNLRASRKLNAGQVHAVVPLYANGYNIIRAPNDDLEHLIDDLLSTSDPAWKQTPLNQTGMQGTVAASSTTFQTSSDSMRLTSKENLEPTTSRASSPVSNSSTITSSGSIIF